MNSLPTSWRYDYGSIKPNKGSESKSVDFPEMEVTMETSAPQPGAVGKTDYYVFLECVKHFSR